jgi:2-polyprenyl-3-methyl-5-hydroxy-6-metoxy-1,4-benzoquinol methylase
VHAAVCWVCGSHDVRTWKRRSIERPLAPDDLRITDARYGSTLALMRCGACEFIFAVDEQLDVLTSLYERLIDPAYVESRDPRTLQMRWLVERIQQVAPRARTLLDVGAGAGLLVAEARRCGLDALGIEPSHALVERARIDNGIDLLAGLFPHPQLYGRTFDIICVVDVIEHVTNPVQLLRDCAAALSPHGVLVVVTPDVGSVAARVMGKRWWHFRLAHVGYFNKASLRQAAARAALVPVDTFTARWFFRVRYIAERLTRYVPMDSVNRVADRMGLLRRIYERVIPLNFHDSVGLVLRRRRVGE